MPKELKNKASKGRLVEVGLFCSEEEGTEDLREVAIVCTPELGAGLEYGIQMQLLSIHLSMDTEAPSAVWLLRTLLL